MNDIDLKVKKLHIDENSEYRIRRGLPWIFDKYCHFDTTPDNGDVVAIYGKRNKCIAIGLYDAYSPIRVRILGSKCTFNQAYMYDKFRAAIEYLSKQGIASNDTTGVRLLSGESQGLPGIVIDAYAGTWVVKVYSAIWLNYIDSFLQMLIDVIGLDDDITRKAYVVPLRRIVLRFGRECRAIYEAAGYREGQLLGSNDDTPYADFMENGMHLRAQVFRGQKTGFFLDQRQNRQIVRSLSAGKKVLDICCYSGGFRWQPPKAVPNPSGVSMAINTPSISSPNIFASMPTIKPSHRARAFSKSAICMNGSNAPNRTAWRSTSSSPIRRVLLLRRLKFQRQNAPICACLLPPPIVLHRGGKSCVARVHRILAPRSSEKSYNAP